MKKWIALGSLILGILAILASVEFTGLNLWGKSFNRVPVRMAASDVRVISPQGHGSGVHIGDGYIVTAAHVVWADGQYTVKDTEGREVEAEILWKNGAYDIALLRVKQYETTGTSRISCKVPERGTEVLSKGNPFDIQFIETRGYIAGPVQNIGNWREAMIADLTLGPGMSGGPVFNRRSEVVGINVGVRLDRRGLSSSPTGFSVIVPASAVCKLLARA